MKRFYLIFGAIVIVILGALAIMGYWPVGFVDGQPIFFNEFNRSYEMAIKFYEANLKSTGQDIVILKAEEVRVDLRRAVLESLITEKIVSRELGNRLASSDLKRMLEEKINKVDLQGEEIKKGAELLYGLSVEDFKDVVLLSKAKEEILDGNLIVEGNSLTQWLKENKEKTKVTIFIPKLAWENGRVVAK